MGTLQWKRVYEKPTDSDGFRILIDRLWPRGIKKEAAELDSWAKEIAPSAELRKSYHHGEINYDEFAAAYRRELDKNSAFTPFIELIRKHLETENVTLLYAGKDPEKSQIPTLRNHINTILRHEGKDVYNEET